MFFKIHRFIFATLAFFGSFVIQGCGDPPPPVTSFATFSQYVQSDKFDQAWDMLTSESQKKIVNKEKLQKLCQGPLASIFGKGVRAEVKFPSFRDDKKVSEGLIFIYDDRGVAQGGERGIWTVREESGEWKVFWTLTTSVTGGGAAEIGN